MDISPTNNRSQSYGVIDETGNWEVLRSGSRLMGNEESDPVQEVEKDPEKSKVLSPDCTNTFLVSSTNTCYEIETHHFLSRQGTSSNPEHHPPSWFQLAVP